MPSIASKYRNDTINIKMKKQIGRETPIINQLLTDEKPTLLHYDSKFDSVTKRLDVSCPKFDKTAAR